MDWDERRLGRHLKLRDLNLLLTVARCGSMGKAAAELSLSQPAISKAIAEMEHRLGVPLLDRRPQGAEVTIYGRVLLERGHVAFDELKQAMKHIEALADPTAGEVSVGSTIALALGFVSAVVDRFCQNYPRVTLHLFANEPETTYRLLSERKVDLSIARIFGPIDQELIHVDALYDEVYLVAASPRNPWTRRRNVRLVDVMKEPWVLPPLDSPIGAMIVQAFRDAGLDVPRRTVFVSTVPARIALLASGRFLTIVSDSVLRFPIDKPAIKVLSIDLPSTRRSIGILTLKNRTVTPATALFIEHARNVAGQVASRRPPRNDKSQSQMGDHSPSAVRRRPEP
jgi:DNA-binding transcriptional LysR family regulator